MNVSPVLPVRSPYRIPPAAPLPAPVDVLVPAAPCDEPLLALKPWQRAAMALLAVMAAAGAVGRLSATRPAAGQRAVGRLRADVPGAGPREDADTTTARLLVDRFGARFGLEDMVRYVDAHRGHLPACASARPARGPTR